MHCKRFTLALAICSAAIIQDGTVAATFRNIPIALPPLGEPVKLRPRGTYDIKLVHQWPPLQFDRWTPIEYYEPYGYVYECEDDGREYIFDSQATRPVLRDILQLQDPLIVEPTILEPIFTFSKPVTVELLKDVGTPVKRQETTLAGNATAILPVPLDFEGKIDQNITPLPESIHILDAALLNPAKHLRGVVDALTVLPATFIRDAIGQGRAMLAGKERKLLDLERFFGDIFHRECRVDGLCVNAANSWLSYITAIQDQAANFERTITQAYRAAALEEAEIDFEQDIILDCGRALIHKIENARIMLMKECEALPSIIDKSRLKQILITPLEYLQQEVEDKSDKLFEKKIDLGIVGINAVNKHSSKIEATVALATEHLLRFPMHILHDIKRDFENEN